MYLILLAILLFAAVLGIAARSLRESKRAGNPAEGFEIIEEPNK